MSYSHSTHSYLLGADLTAALAYYGVGILAFARLVGINSRTLLRWQKVQAGNPNPLPRWIEWPLFIFDRNPEYRKIQYQAQLVIKEWGLNLDGDWLPSGPQVAEMLTRFGVPIERYAAHLGKNPNAVRDYLAGIKEPIQAWHIWPLIAYTYHPGVRLLDEPPRLPMDKWPY